MSGQAKLVVVEIFIKLKGSQSKSGTGIGKNVGLVEANKVEI